MTLSGRIAAAAVVAVLLSAAPAAADDYCVGGGDGCLPTLAAALDAARAHAGPDRILLGAGDHAVPAGAADGPGEPVELIGRGTVTRLIAEAGSPVTLRLEQPASRLEAVEVAAPGEGATESLVVAGAARRVDVTGAEAPGALAVRLLPGGRLTASVVAGPVAAAAPARIERSVLRTDRAAALLAESGEGTVIAESLEVTTAAGAAAALETRCATLVARHLTVLGAAPRVIDGGCPEPATAAVELRDSLVHGEFDDVAPPGAGATSRHSAHADDAEVAADNRLDLADPGFTSGTDLRPAAGSPLVDAGSPEALLPGEGFWDHGGRARVTDGNGDGVLRRDVGAHERQPPAVEPPAGNVLLNPGAEAGEPLFTTGEGPEPAGWTRVGAFTSVGYGTSAGDIALPTLEAGEALGAGRAFFSAGPGAAASLTQRIDIAASAAQIDTGLATAALSGLLGGYGADEDQVKVSAIYRDPAGNAIGVLQLGAVSPADRANGTNLVARSAAGAIPERTRAIDVEIAGTRVGAAGSGETYADAYADNLALVLSVPGISMPGPVDPDEPPVKNLKPFAGVTVLTGRPRLSRRGRAKVRVACASATVGRCSGSLELRAQLRRGLAFSRIAQFARFSVAPGRASTVTVKLTLAARRALRRARSFRATLRAVARDGQGLERRTTIPIRVRRR